MLYYRNNAAGDRQKGWDKMSKNEFNREIMAAYRGNIGNAAHELVSNAKSMVKFIADRQVDLQTRAALLNDWRDVCVKIAAAQKILQNEIDAFDK